MIDSRASRSTSGRQNRALKDLFHEMRKDAAVAPQRLRRKKYFNAAYLVVDEVGFEPMTREDAGLFFRLVSYRYCRGSTAITTNTSVKDWPGSSPVTRRWRRRSWTGCCTGAWC